MSLVAAALLVAGVAGAVTVGRSAGERTSGPGHAAAGRPPGAASRLGGPDPASRPGLIAVPVTPAPTTTLPAVGPVTLPLTGCPPPPRRPGGTTARPWHPSVLVPEAALPRPLEAPAHQADLTPLEGKGMWLWKFRQSEGGDPDAIVARATAAGLRQLWVRVGDSSEGFYGADTLSGLVGRAHARGLAVIGWGFPYLWDPVADARWSADALAWRGPRGERLDGFSPDVEMASEGVELSELRARVYLGLVRQAAGDRLVVATVYRPNAAVRAAYPYDAMAPYVDAFAPMVYWGCTEPGEAAAEALEHLRALRPVHLIGQAFDMAAGGGRSSPPGAAETTRFLDVARRGGAAGASFWVWQYIGPEQWAALSAYPW